MGGLRKRVCSLRFGLTALSLAVVGAAAAASTTDQWRYFAVCTGRLSAVTEFQWLVQDPGADATEARRDAMAALLEAALPTGAAVVAMDWRLQAKVAEAWLLSRARFGQSGPAADWAREQAAKLAQDCAALLLG